MFKPERKTVHAYFVLLQVGFAPAAYCYDASGALTARFHPYPSRLSLAGRLFSVALSMGLHPPEFLRYLFRLESGLSSPLQERSPRLPHT